MAQVNKNPNEMSFLDHLEELRWHLIRSTMAIVIIGVVAFLMKDFIFDTIIFGPKKMSFPTYRLFCDIANSMEIYSIIVLFPSSSSGSWWPPSCFLWGSCLVTTW